MSTMTDKELLELAAKAVGGTFSPGSSKKRTGETWETWEWIGPLGITMPNGVVMRPLISDGDALKLAVKLGLIIELGRTFTTITLPNGGTVCITAMDVECGYYAARLAIVRAAAEIGRAIE